MPGHGFHIHVDAHAITDNLREYIIHELGYYQSDFVHVDDGRDHFEPLHHLTLKTTNFEDHKRQFECLRKLLMVERPAEFRGYIEGERLVRELPIESKPFDPVVPLPFRRIERGSPPAGLDTFRESEIHVTLGIEGSDPRLGANLYAMGLYVGTFPEDYGLAEIYTVQGRYTEIQGLVKPLLKYLRAAGGAVHGLFEHEDIVKRPYGFAKSAPDVRLPHVVRGEIRWNDTW